MTIFFDQTESGLLVRDPVENAEYPIEVDGGGEANAGPASSDAFSVPVDAASEVEAQQFTFPTLVNIFVREQASGDAIATASPGDDTVVPAGAYEVEIASAPIKLYFSCTGTSLTVNHRPGHDETEIRFDNRATVQIAGRSHHEQPAGTITTTDSPRDLMEAVSTFGSALKTQSPERSFPTLRGHPPLIEQGPALSIPDHLESPDTGLTIRVPPRRPAVFAVTPLAYYLGATVEPAADNSAHLEVEPTDSTIPLTASDDGYPPATNWSQPSTSGDTAPEIADAANRVLTHIFTLDCAVRTEGLYEVDLDTRSKVDARLEHVLPADPESDSILPIRPTTSGAGGELAGEPTRAIDYEALYQMPLADRTAAYLELPRDVLSDVLSWPFGAGLADIAENTRLLSPTAYKLAHVFSPPRSTAPPVEEQASEAVIDAVDAFHRSGRPSTGNSGGESGTTAAFPGLSTDTILSPAAGYLGHLWAADGVPVGSVKPSPIAHQRSLERDPSEAAIRILVVCNDDLMDAEATDLYGVRELLSFDITVTHNLTCAELRDELRSDYDLLHYIGHIDDEGVLCEDGRLDIRDVEDVGVDAFLLNGCRSYDQGAALIEQGSCGGFVTTERVGNRVATRAGRTLAALLDAGFPLYGALDVIRSELALGSRYSVFGDGLVTLSPASGVPTLNSIDGVRDREVEVTALTYPTRQVGLGSMCSPAFGSSQMYLATGPLETTTLPVEDAVAALQRDQNPILVGGELVWADDADLESVLRAADSTTDGTVQDVLSAPEK